MTRHGIFVEPAAGRVACRSEPLRRSVGSSAKWTRALGGRLSIPTPRRAGLGRGTRRRRRARRWPNSITNDAGFQIWSSPTTTNLANLGLAGKFVAQSAGRCWLTVGLCDRARRRVRHHGHVDGQLRLLGGQLSRPLQPDPGWPAAVLDFCGLPSQPCQQHGPERDTVRARFAALDLSL